MRVIAASDPSQISLFHDVRRQWRRRLMEGNFYAEGEQVVFRLLQSQLKLISLLTTPLHFERWRHLLESREDSDSIIWIAEKKWIEDHTGQKLNQPCIAIAKIPPSAEITDCSAQDRCCFVALDGLQHAVNVGSIFRTCAAFDASCVLVDSTTTDTYCFRSVNASLGGVFQAPLHRATRLQDSLRKLQRSGICLIAADPTGLVPISAVDFSARCCLIFGGEHHGISKEVLGLADQRIAIPIATKIDSLNVAATTAIFLYHATRIDFSARSR